MAVNPMVFIKMKERLRIFQEQHPRFPAFLKQVNRHALIPGAILEMKVTTPEGKEYVTNLRLTEDDVETVRMAAGLKSGSQGDS